jgi:hypothetical protein
MAREWGGALLVPQSWLIGYCITLKGKKMILGSLRIGSQNLSYTKFDALIYQLGAIIVNKPQKHYSFSAIPTPCSPNGSYIVSSNKGGSKKISAIAKA